MLGKMLRKQMIDADIKQSELAERLGVSQQALSARLLSENMRESTFYEIAGAMGYEVEIIFKK